MGATFFSKWLPRFVRSVLGKNSEIVLLLQNVCEGVRMTVQVHVNASLFSTIFISKLSPMLHTMLYYFEADVG